MTPLNALIPTDLHRQLKIEAINSGRTIQEMVREAIERLLKARDDSGKPPAARRR